MNSLFFILCRSLSRTYTGSASMTHKKTQSRVSAFRGTKELSEQDRAQDIYTMSTKAKALTTLSTYHSVTNKYHQLMIAAAERLVIPFLNYPLQLLQLKAHPWITANSVLHSLFRLSTQKLFPSFSLYHRCLLFVLLDKISPIGFLL